MKLADIDLVEMHEAFAAQVASNLQALASKEFAKKAASTRPSVKWTVHPERDGRLHLHRAPVRCHGRAHHHAGPQ
ncbi:hypothetical protein [Corallococcus exiguus]|uniref:hypothetical protein n=1 Tax=Corallococcus exiguus TaxID=83462 RepID=UPI0023EC5DEF|nr:hypothetical protein [Corallococcus exiguus]